MQSDIQIIRHAARCRIDIEGTIGVPEQEQFDPGSRQVATWERFRRTVEEIRRISAPEVIVNIRSTGGDVNDALLIHDALRSLGGRITTRCYGYTASAATVIAQAASPGCRELSANTLYLIHRSVCASEGNADELAARLDLLRKTDERLAEVYAARSGRAKADFEALMGENNGNGRWLSPREAIAAGLTDRIVQDAEAAAGRGPRAWVRRLAERLRPVYLRPRTLPAAGPSILHFGEPGAPDEPATPPAPVPAVRQEALPTRTLPREDPPIGEAAQTRNRLAYERDARRLAER